VKKDPRFHRYASDALGAARTIFTIGPEIVERLGRVFPEQALADRMVGLNLGVDTSAFSLRQSDRALADLRAALKGLECASGPDAHDRKLPDAGLEDRMAGVAPGDPLLLFVGRLIASKGPQAVIAALPDILAAQPAARLICVGHGPLRPCLESMVKALAQGDIAGLRELARAHDLTEVSAYLAQVDLEVYAARAREHVCAQRVIFAGYLTHRELRHLFAACQVAVFPSVVAEAGPLVFLEALASGCFPIGTYFAGMGASIDAIGSALPAEDAEVMKLRREPEHLVADIARQVGAAFLLRGRHRNSLREIAVERYDWRQVAERWKVGLVGK
jgi:glycosyltransferase involved in cell wall biosynthesis